MQSLVRLYLSLFAWALWMGGFVFYFGVVVPVGADVVGGSSQGLVTQEVTNWMNWIGLAALSLFLWSVIVHGGRLQVATWLVMLVCQLVLFGMHWKLDSMIAGASPQLAAAGPFRTLHESYEIVATVQWLAGMLFLFCLIKQLHAPRTQRRGERLTTPSSSSGEDLQGWGTN
jgi:hypothetical protein